MDLVNQGNQGFLVWESGLSGLSVSKPENLKTWIVAYLTTLLKDLRTSRGYILEPFSGQNGSEKRLRLEIGPSDHKHHIK